MAESELNRAGLLEDWQAITEHVRSLTDRVKTVGAFATAAARLVAGVAAGRRHQASAPVAKPSWFHRILKGAQLAGSTWFTLCARSR